jgi:hypothetical protein
MRELTRTNGSVSLSRVQRDKRLAHLHTLRVVSMNMGARMPLPLGIQADRSDHEFEFISDAVHACYG